MGNKYVQVKIYQLESNGIQVNIINIHYLGFLYLNLNTDKILYLRAWIKLKSIHSMVRSVFRLEWEVGFQENWIGKFMLSSTIVSSDLPPTILV